MEINEKKGCFLIKTNNGSFKAEYVVNAAGLYADDIAKMVDAADFEVTGWKAQQLVVENRDYTRRVLCGAPRPQRGRLVIPTTHNSLIVAHTFHPMTNKRDRSTTREGVTELLTWLHEFLPTMSDKHLISAFSGFLTFNTKNPNDHLLESPKRGFITVAVSAPGLGPAPAIAREIVRMLADQGLECTTRSDFNPYRYKAPRFIDLSAWEKNDRIKTEPEYAERFMTQLNEMDLRLCLNTMVTHLDSDRGIVAINPEWGEFKVNPRAVVLAMGCREKSRFSIGIPGSRPAGVFTAGLAQKLVNVDGYMPGESFVILGSGDIGMIMARRLHLERAKVKAVVEIMPHVGGLIRNEVQCLHDFDIPLLLEHTVSEIYGNDRVEGVKIAQVDRDGNVIKETERDVPCDCLLLSVGLIPENELSVEAGIELDDRIGGPIVDEYLQTNIDGIFAAGNVLQVWDLVDNVTLDGEKTGVNAARFVAGELKKQPKAIEVIPGEDIRTITPHRIVGSEDVDFALRVQRPLQDAEVRIGDKTKKFRVLSPTEVVKVTLKPSEMEPFRESGKIEVSCYERK